MIAINKLLYNPDTREYFVNVSGDIIKLKLNGSSDAGVTQVSSLPQVGKEGSIYYNITDKQYYTYTSENGWQSTGNADVVSNPNDIAHAILVSDDSTVANAKKVDYVYTLKPGVFYNVDDWLTVDDRPTVDADVVNITLAFAFDANTDSVFAGRFTAWEDNINLMWPAGVVIANQDDIDIVNGHTYEFNAYQGVAILMDLGSLDE